MNKEKAFLVTSLVLILLLGFFQYLYTYDNKYDHQQAPIQDGSLDLQQLALATHEVYALVDNWHFYPQVQNVDELQNMPYTTIYIGQYPDYSMRDDTQQPYGTAAYRVQLHNHSEPQSLSLFLPEIDVAYELWINGERRIQNGDIRSPIQAYIKYQIVEIDVSTTCDIVLIASNDSFYYSGMYYPILLSDTQGIYDVVIHKLLFYSFLCFSTFSLVCYSLILWLRSHRPLQLALGIAASCFTIFIALEIFRFLGFSHVQFMYAVNDAAYFLMMTSIIYINALLVHIQKKKWFQCFFCLSIGIVFISLLSPCYLPYVQTKGLQLYGTLIDFFKTITTIFILYTSYVGIQKQLPIYIWALLANACYSTGVFYTLWQANRFEPIRYGWPNEYSSYFFICFFAIFMICENHMILKENVQLTQHLQETVEQRTQQLQTLLTERKALLSEIAHDMKAPISSIHSFVDIIQHGNIAVDEEVGYYLSSIQQKSNEMIARMQELQNFNKLDDIVSKRSPILLQDFLLDFYQKNKPDCDASAIYFSLHMEDEPIYIYANKQQLLRVFENLLYNALAFTNTNGHITISQTYKEHMVWITFHDDGEGISPQYLPHIFEQGKSFARKTEEGHGLGLYIVKSILLQHDAQIEVQSTPSTGTTFIIKFPVYYGMNR